MSHRDTTPRATGGTSIDRRRLLTFGAGGAVAVSLGATGRAAPPDDPFDRELHRLRHVDPAVLTWDEVDRIGVDLTRPRGIASGADGRVWVAGDRALVLLDRGRLRARLLLQTTPSCVAESPDGTEVVVGHEDHLEVRGTDLALRSAWAVPGDGTQITGVAVGADVVWAADAGTKAVHRWDRGGRPLGRLGGPTPQGPHFVIPSPFFDLGMDPAGSLWVANPGRHRIERYTADGELATVVGTSGADIGAFCGCCNPTHLAVLPDGRLVTSEKGLPRVKVLRPSGELDSVIAAGERLAAGVVGLDLAVDALGRVLVLDPGERAVRVFAPKRTVAGRAAEGPDARRT